MTEAVQIDRISEKTIIVPIIGETPLITHRFSEKNKRIMSAAMRGEKLPKEPKDPIAEFKDAAYRCGTCDLKSPRTELGGYGMPSIAFKEATVAAARFYPKNDVTMVGLRQFLYFGGVPSMPPDSVSVVEITNPDEDYEGDWPRMREDAVTVGRGGTDLRYRPEFFPWAARLIVKYVSSMIDEHSIVSMIEAGGRWVGVGEWRPQRRGDFGMYKTDPDKDIERIG